MGINHPHVTRFLIHEALRPSARSCRYPTTPLCTSASAITSRSTRSGPELVLIEIHIRPTTEIRPPGASEKALGRLQVVGLGELRVLAGQHLGEVDHDA